MSTRIFAGAGHWTGGPDAGKGGGMWSRTVGNGGWQRVGGGLPADAEVRAIAMRPGEPRVIYAGTQHGPYRSTDGGERWTALPLPDPGMVVWSFLFEPGNPRVMYVGTAPTAMYKSADGGDTWRRLSALRAPGQVKMSFATRVIGMTADPSRPQEIYAGLEVDGVVRSRDGGETWEDCSADLARLSQRSHLKSRIVSDTEMEGMLDSHALCMSKAKPGTVFLAVRMGLFRSGDGGKSWEDMEVGRFSPLTYARNVQVSPHDPRTLYAALSPAARSDAGTVYRSDDLGQSWWRFDRGVTARSTMMTLALHPGDPEQVYCGTRGGQVFGTQDGGKTWSEYPLPEGIQDVYTVACA